MLLNLAKIFLSLALLIKALFCLSLLPFAKNLLFTLGKIEAKIKNFHAKNFGLGQIAANIIASLIQQVSMNKFAQLISLLGFTKLYNFIFSSFELYKEYKK